MLTVTYNPLWVYGWLSVPERKGLDVEATLDRFEGKVRRELMRWAFVEGVQFKRKDIPKMKIGPEDSMVDQMYLQIQNLFIDCHFLVYRNPNAHVKALRETVNANLRVSLIEDMVEAYQIPRATADMIISLHGKEIVDYQAILDSKVLDDL